MAVIIAIRAGKSVFFTGSARTGKSYLLKRLITMLPPQSIFITASAGAAACHIGGTTLHVCVRVRVRVRVCVCVCVWYASYVLQVSSRLCCCIVHFSEYLWFICCPKIFYYFCIEKCILKVAWSTLIFPHYLTREYYLDFSQTVVSYYPRDFWFNFFHELFPSKTYHSAACPLGAWPSRAWIRRIFDTFKLKMPWKTFQRTCWFISYKLCALVSVDWSLEWMVLRDCNNYHYYYA